MGDFRVTIFGAGNLGAALAAHLTRGPGGFAVEILDPSEQALDRLRDLDLPVTLRLLPRED
ncbi:MAG: pyridine nucleotide-disulfide oxidoreductase, partial [Proteobacteria bacterium]|nr:pyridine nucleotide-disulfide oxidoreductase [Pseudomonadota bacterium]